MAEKTKTITVKQCDFCHGGDACYDTCLHCGKDVCFDCKHNKDVGVEYSHSVFVSGSGDGWYCHECDAVCDSELHMRYRQIRGLRREYQAFSDDFQKRAKACEEQIKQLRESAATPASADR